MGAGNGAITLTTSVVKTYIQNLPEIECTTTAKTIWDNRDEQPYAIKRLGDGNCWIIENLNLGAVSISKDLDSTNTNITGTITSTEFNSDSSVATDNWKVLPDASYASATHSTALKPRYIQITSSNSQTGSDTDPTAGTKYGVLYNYCAASGETICIANNTANATEDICPTGWRLPTGGSGGEFATLYSQSAYNSYANMRKSIANGGPAFAFAGTFSASGMYYQNQRGHFWSSNRSSNTNMYALYFANGTIQTSGSLARTNLYSMRCLLK